MTMAWWYSFKVRVKNGSGTVQKTWCPLQRPVRVGPPSYEHVREELELLNHDLEERYHGFRAHLTAVLERVGGSFLGYPNTLEDVLALATTAGYYLEACLSDNILTAPQDISNAAFTVSSATKSASGTAVTAPDGTSTTLSKVRVSGTGAGCYIRQAVTPISIVAGMPYTFSVYLKAATAPVTVTIKLLDQAGTLINSADCSVTTSWQRFSVSCASPAAATGLIVQVGTWAYGTEPDVDSWGWQLNEAEGLTGYSSAGDWKRVRCGAEWAPDMPGGKRNAVAVELELSARSLQTTLPAPSSGTW